MNWQRAALLDVSVLGPQYGANVRAVPSSGGTVRYVRITDIDEWGRLRRNSWVEPESENLNDYLLEDGDILLARSGATVGKSYVYSTEDGPCVFAGYLIRFRLDRRVVEPRYLAYYLQTREYWSWIRAIKRVAAQPNVNGAEYASLPLPIPPLSEQRRIVEILDQADRLRRLRAEADAKAERILPALFVKMFGDPVQNPMKWPLNRFADICECRLGKMLDGRQQTGEHRRSYLRNANVHWDSLDLGQVFEMDFDESDRKEFRLRKGDLLICEGGEVGRCAIWNEELPECYFQKALHRARPIAGKAVSEYLLYLLRLLANGGALADSTSKATFAHLTGVKLGALKVPVAPLLQQEEFARGVRATKVILQVAARGARRLHDLFTVLMRGAFAGDLTASWREAHMSGLVEEMEQQATTLREIS